MKVSTKKTSIRWQILIPVCLIITVLCAVIGGYTYSKSKSSLVAVGLDSASIAANIASADIDGNKMAQITQAGEKAPYYNIALKELRNVKDRSTICALFTLYQKDGKMYYGLDADTSSNQGKPGDEAPETASSLKEVYAGRSFVQPEIFELNGSYRITAYVPLTNKDGNVVAVLGCDYDAGHIVKSLSSLRTKIVIISLIALLLSLVIVNLIIARIMRNLQIVDDKISELASSEGDLTHVIDIASGDELEHIAENINKLLFHIHEIMSNIAMNSQKLNDSARNIASRLNGSKGDVDEISATTEEMTAAVEQTTASLNLVNESINDIFATVKIIFENSTQGSKSSKVTIDKAAEVYQNAINEQAAAKEQAQRLADTVHQKIEMSKSVEQIRALTDNIITITEQTNLLSLNASIEAARAGESGRGFAVVAGEIGKLAAHSGEAATEIQKVSKVVITTVNELAVEAEKMLVFMNETAMTGYEKLLDTSRSYHDDVENMDNLMQEFAERCSQLSSNMDSIQHAVNDVTTAMNENAEGITRIAEMSSNLTSSIGELDAEAMSNENIAVDLHCEVNKFRL